jgi:hypothetical protein
MHKVQKAVHPAALKKMLTTLAVATLACAGGTAAQAMTTAEIEAQYKADVAQCHQGSSIDREACMREAGAAREAARRNNLTDPNTSFTQNQMQRCQSLPQGQREECMKQMSGQDTRVMGSVEGGGVLRETTIQIPAEPAAVPGTSVDTGTSTMPVR